jgi:hypothetical protein
LVGLEPGRPVRSLSLFCEGYLGSAVPVASILPVCFSLLLSSYFWEELIP